MFTMSHRLIALQSNENSYTFSFKDTSLDSTAPKFLDMFSRQN